MRTHCATLRTRRRGPGLDAFCPLHEQVKAGGRQGGGSAVRVREGRDPRARSRNPKPRQRQAALPERSKAPTWGTGTSAASSARRPGRPNLREVRRRREAGPGAKPESRQRRGPWPFPRPPSPWRASRLQTHPSLPPTLSPGFVPVGSHKGLTSRPSEHLRHFSGRAFLELRANLQST